ncbi:MAG: chemotaxis protein CheD [Alphaproteobacteria bacterium PA2]|nr:MAG: chemotaxis protein CheD [Alphaproteobacteria bacterium PA2]
MGASAFQIGMKKIHVIQGEHYVTSDPDVVLTTILGSCVAVCLRDVANGIGGMNHFLLPEGPSDGTGESRRYGAFAMELLINDVLKMGGMRRNLEGKLFGGARMSSGLTDIGAKNAAFAEQFMADEGIDVVSRSLGGFEARRIQYWPILGKAQQRTVSNAREVARLDEAPKLTSKIFTKDEGSLELF